jgi:hypothetical protein
MAARHRATPPSPRRARHRRSSSASCCSRRRSLASSHNLKRFRSRKHHESESPFERNRLRERKAAEEVAPPCSGRTGLSQFRQKATSVAHREGTMRFTQGRRIFVCARGCC